MASATVKYPAAIFYFFLLMFLKPLPAHSLPFPQLYAISYLPHWTRSLSYRVANLRASRGDFVGAARAQALAKKLESLTGHGFWKSSLTMGWDYLTNNKNNLQYSIKEEVEAIIKELVEGELFRDCMEVGIGDLKGLIHIIKEISTHFVREDADVEKGEQKYGKEKKRSQSKRKVELKK